ncbi:hypothetical protein HDF24_18385 [Mucilaginibacter sp. X4EP1]|uniref:hypothetical protein n=1 Tax=Mucilaginibacter sp. X4EP1 TaxID=2723092 RepID=UPI002168CE03|nr:hypothetical protein [Mucilaginibacter sp. X4EP1]MCS3813460.1 hypothetical protein [Mucilaginibacter sp. X4EP1]
MKKRKAKRIKQANDIHNNQEASEAINEYEKMQEQKLIDLIVQVMVRITLEEFYGDKEPPI